MRTTIQDAIANKEFVRVKRSIPKADRIDGFIVDTSPTWTQMHSCRDVSLDGYIALRTSDITSIEPDHSIWSKALELYGEKPKRPSGIKFNSIRELLQSAQTKFGLVAIHLEIERPNVCHIGEVVATNTRTLRLLEVSADPFWYDTPTLWPLKSITRVDFDNEYNRALVDVAGKPPK